MTPIPPQPEKEALGDWCGFKGTWYHLTFAVWLLLTRQASEVMFYAGNDLLAQPDVPPEVLGPSVSCGLLAPEPDIDQWIQVKNRDKPWTPSTILTDSLLSTFILNALLSESRRRKWSVRLATAASIREKDILTFVKAPHSARGLNAKFERIVEAAHRAWSKHLSSAGVSSGPEPDATHVRNLALKVLTQLAGSRVLAHDLLIKDIELKLTQRYYDAVSVNQVAQALSGRLLNALHQKLFPRAVSLKWLEDNTGYNLRPDDLLTTDVIEACRVQIEKSQPPRWSAESCVPRPHLSRALTEYLEDDSCLFVLVGESGSGKSWFTSDWALNGLREKVRVRIGATDILGTTSVAALVASVMRSLARPHATDEEIFRILKGAATGNRGPFVVIADDLPTGIDPSLLSRRLETVCRECRSEGIKLVLAMRPSVWRYAWRPELLAPFLYRRPAAPADPAASDPAPVSCRVTLLADDEIQAIVGRLVPSKKVTAKMMRQLMQPRLSALRNPYLLSVYLQSFRGPPAKVPVSLPAPDSLLDNEIQRRFDAVAQRVGVPPD